MNPLPTTMHGAKIDVRHKDGRWTLLISGAAQNLTMPIFRDVVNSMFAKPLLGFYYIRSDFSDYAIIELEAEPHNIRFIFLPNC